MAKWKELPQSIEAMAKRIEELEAEKKRLDKMAITAYMLGFDDGFGDPADYVWDEFKDKWDGERKFALRQIVKYLKEQRDVDIASDPDD